MYGLIGSFSLSFALELGGGDGCWDVGLLIGGWLPGWLVSSQPLGFTEWWKNGGRGEGEEKQDGSSNFINLRLN